MPSPTMEHEKHWPDYRGKTVALVRSGQVNGYDRLEIVFSDGTTIVAHEEGQCGYFTVNGEPTTNE